MSLIGRDGEGIRACTFQHERCGNEPQDDSSSAQILVRFPDHDFAPYVPMLEIMQAECRYAKHDLLVKHDIDDCGLTILDCGQAGHEHCLEL